MSIRLVRNTCFQLPDRWLETTVLTLVVWMTFCGVQFIYNRAKMRSFTHSVEVLLKFSVHLPLIVVGQK